MRTFAGLAPVEKTESQKLDTVKALANKWKIKAKEQAAQRSESPTEEKTPLLFGKVNSINSEPAMDTVIENTAKEVAEEEEKEEKSFGRLLAESLFYMLFGAALVAFFSDPMVDALTDIGSRLSINPFYISFLVTPFCSNASELIASLVFAAKKIKNLRP